MITLVLGGARSGKSEFAERLADRHGPPITYLATGVATDPDMAGRIAAHRRRRPASWTTVECGTDVAGVLAATHGTVLLDALGTWVARLDGFEADAAALCDALRERGGATVVVSEEVGLGVHPATDAGRRFRDQLGALNRAVSAVADAAYLVVAGRALALGALVEVAAAGETSVDGGKARRKGSAPGA